MKINKLTFNSSTFPEKLQNIPAPPKQLYILGDPEILSAGKSLSVVGSRKVTPYGKQITLDLVGSAASRGVTILSGLALGVDALAHRAALDNSGVTIAVLPCGLDKIYPSSNHQLAKEILQKGGALISEYPAGTPPLRQHFIARNRLVSGLGEGVLITEAAEKSGTLHTANFALEQGKTVMAVPGAITSPTSAGTNNLIKAGAVVVTTAADILQALDIQNDHDNQTEIIGSNHEETAILRLLVSGVTDASELLAHSKLDASVFNQTLTMLELTGKIRPLGAGHWALK